MLYEYKCKQCGTTLVGPIRATEVLCLCGGMATRRFSFNIATPMQEHYNPTLGQYVSNSRQFKEGLQRQAESVSIHTGIEHTFQPVTMHDKEAIGVTDEGLYETAKHNHDKAAK